MPAGRQRNCPDDAGDDFENRIRTDFSDDGRLARHLRLGGAPLSEDDQQAGRKAADYHDPAGLPAIAISAGAAPGSGVSTPADWFDRADKALYKTKRGGRKGVTLFEDEAAART